MTMAKQPPKRIRVNGHTYVLAEPAEAPEEGAPGPQALTDEEKKFMDELNKKMYQPGYQVSQYEADMYNALLKKQKSNL
jgi:hypothetical protein